MNTVTIRTASALAEPHQWIDVRSPGEYASGHIPGAVNIPMDQIEARLDDLLPKVPILLVCQAGKRARMVAGLIQPCRADVTVLEGGTEAWRAAGLPLVNSVKTRFSLDRQVRLIAGILILIGVALSLTVNRYCILLSAFVGAGLALAGLTDICMMGGLLARMPWNRARSSVGTRKDAATSAQTCTL